MPSAQFSSGKIIVALASLFAVTVAQANVGFSHGDKLSFVRQTGWAWVQCSGPQSMSHTQFCSQELVTPGDFDSLVATPAPQADHVRLSVTHSNGKTVSKLVKFDASKGHSESVNLTVAAVFQRPLLAVGENQVNYEFLNGNQSIESGSFTASLTFAGEMKCPMVTVFSSSCEGVGVSCDTYFNQVPNCRAQ